ncbi:carboxymuconolactone decarboxylase family protein [Alkalicoccus daliensis]|uniref:4-carboxymuconolactone decarboxylase n=1 Tax=Alkalicoccus daliensis TaxID=745820 RepID=A0A1H0HVG9_9BACI|nr:carboxymuconolactone decarboxylase family protein [Alkalicoccus daliensis]SDO23168.1 4-carboxymuconolactone decarboxylase [Alkalicoccus daliensis]
MNSKKENYEHGMHVLHQLTDEKGVEMIKGYNDISPEFVDMMVSFGFGEVYSMKVLELKQHTMITITSLISQGAFEQLPFHVRAGLRVGLRPEEIIHIILHCAAYAGFPKAASAMRITKEIFEELGIEVDQAAE